MRKLIQPVLQYFVLGVFSFLRNLQGKNNLKYFRNSDTNTTNNCYFIGYERKYTSLFH